MNAVVPTPRARVLAWWAIAVALCGAAWMLDPFAEAAFDAPKRLCVLAGAIVASAALLSYSPLPDWRRWSSTARWILAAALAGMMCMLLSALVSPHQDLAWTALRRTLIMALFAALGASHLLDGTAGTRMFGVFLLACASNVLLSLAQSAGLEFLPIAQVGGRFATGALLGNEGFVALAAAMMAAACIACAVNVASRRARAGFVALAVLGVLVIVLNRQKTSGAALAAALLVIVALRWRQRWIFAGLAGLLLLGAVSALVPPLRAATWAKVPLSSYQQLTTYRLGAWIAAADMAVERPLTGYGPGSFAAEVEPHRLGAEIRLRERLAPPTSASFVHAHQDYLQLAAEAGVPALLLLLGALGALLAALTPPTLEQQVLLAIAAVGVVAAFGWFPMHIPFTACALLLCAGRAWRLVADPPEAPR